MHEIRLLKPTLEYGEQIMAFRQEIFAADTGEDAFAGCGSLRNCKDAENWLEHLCRFENAETVPAGYVPSSTYIAVRVADDRVVGIIDLRHHIDHPVLSVWGGHIGYSVRPSERQRGYATEMLRLHLENCRARGMEKILITCDRKNVASEKTILANGGIFEREVKVDGDVIRRFWITL